MFPAIPIVSQILGIGQTYLETTAKKKQAQTEAEIQVLKKATESEQDWRRLMSEGSHTSWKDEYWTIVLSIPAIMAFIPSMQEYVKEGFEALNNAPDWYMWSLLTAIAASFGLRAVSKYKR